MKPKDAFRSECYPWVPGHWIAISGLTALAAITSSEEMPRWELGNGAAFSVISASCGPKTSQINYRVTGCARWNPKRYCSQTWRKGKCWQILYCVSRMPGVWWMKQKRRIYSFWLEIWQGFSSPVWKSLTWVLSACGLNLSSVKN